MISGTVKRAENCAGAVVSSCWASEAVLSSVNDSRVEAEHSSNWANFYGICKFSFPFALASCYLFQWIKLLQFPFHTTITTTHPTSPAPGPLPLFSLPPCRPPLLFFDQKVSQQPRRLLIHLRCLRCQELVCFLKRRHVLSWVEQWPMKEGEWGSLRNWLGDR